MIGTVSARLPGRTLALALLCAGSLEAAAHGAAVTVVEGRLPFANTGGSSIDQGQPIQASSSYSQVDPITGATTASSASANLRNGVLRASAATTGSVGVSQASASAYFSDTLTFNVPGADGGTVTSIGFAFDVGGTRSGDGNSSSDHRFVFSILGRRFGQTSLYEQIYSANGADYFSGTSFTDNGGFQALNMIDLGDLTRITGLFEVVGPAAFAAFELNLQAKAADGGVSNYSISNFNFTMPQNVTFTSASGVFLSESDVPVPEPSALALLCLGLFGVAIGRRKPAERSA